MGVVKAASHKDAKDVCAILHTFMSTVGEPG